MDEKKMKKLTVGDKRKAAKVKVTPGRRAARQHINRIMKI